MLRKWLKRIIVGILLLFLLLLSYSVYLVYKRNHGGGFSMEDVKKALTQDNKYQDQQLIENAVYDNPSNSGPKCSKC